jgi:selenocysteine lyase/cysteine desulfurase
LVEELRAGLAELPVEMLTESANRSGIVAFRHEKGSAITSRLAEQSIAVNFNVDRVRVSVHGYNTAADVKTFLAVLTRILKSL